MLEKFHNLVSSYLEILESGEIFRQPIKWLYTIFAILNLLVPIAILYYAFDNGILDLPARYFFVFLFSWPIIALAGWITFKLWLKRRSELDLTTEKGNDFVATPIYANLIQTSGEWLGTWIAILGFGTGIISSIFLSGDAGYIFEEFFDIYFFSQGLFLIILAPVYGLLFIIFSRFIAEQFRALAAIANNTKPREKVSEEQP
jgi:hypothetical protein